MNATETALKTVMLKNGSEEFGPLVAVTMMSLRSLCTTDPVSFYELVQKCRDQNHQFWGNSTQKLRDLSLIQPSGNVHDSIRNIVLSAVTGEKFDMVLGSPIATS